MVKVKCYSREEFAIVGFEPEGKHRIAALHLARKAGRTWAYVGKVGTGFSGKVSVELRKKLDELATEKPIVALANRRRDTTAVKPTHSAQVEYRTITPDGQSRPCLFKGLE